MERAPDKHLVREAINDLRDLGNVPGINAPEVARLAELLAHKRAPERPWLRLQD
jgi:hypothetical protein